MLIFCYLASCTVATLCDYILYVCVCQFGVCGCSQKKAVRSRHKQLAEDELDGKDEKLAGVRGIHKSGSRDSAGSSDDDSSSEGRKKGDDSTTETVLAVPEANERRISITLTTSDRPSKTFITDLKTADLTMVNRASKLQSHK